MVLKAWEEKKNENNEDLKSFIFDENEIVKKKVFTSHLLEDNIFGFGLLLPRNEDVKDKKGEILGQENILLNQMKQPCLMKDTGDKKWL